MKEIKNNAKEYEMAYLLTPEIIENDLESEIAELKKIITENGGEAPQTNTAQIRRLAYPIKKQYQAYFGVIYFNIDSDGLDKIKKALALYKKVLRYLILVGVAKPKSEMTANQRPPESEKPAVNQSFDQKLKNLLNR